MLEVTRFRVTQKPSKLDYIFTTQDDLVGDLEYVAPLGKCDHVCSKWSYRCSTLTVHRTSTARRTFWKGDYAAMKTMLLGIDCEKELENRNVEEAWNEINQRCM